MNVPLYSFHWSQNDSRPYIWSSQKAYEENCANDSSGATQQNKCNVNHQLIPVLNCTSGKFCDNLFMQMILNGIQKHQEMINVTVMEKNIVQSPLGSEVALKEVKATCT
jgi:hypothetical protein